MNSKEFIELKEKGCGTIFDFSTEEFGILRMSCGKWTRMSTPELYEKMEWCPACKSELKSLIQMRIACIDEEIDNLEYLGLVKIKEKEPIEFETIYNNDTFNLVNNRIEKLKQEKEELNKKLEGLQ